MLSYDKFSKSHYTPPAFKMLNFGKFDGPKLSFGILLITEGIPRIQHRTSIRITCMQKALKVNNVEEKDAGSAIYACVSSKNIYWESEIESLCW